ncbi:MAG: hypothetical protein O2931_00900 [Planctomycetota bacterium]|nr:hypothetical protein [Planctomycetota bacterium]MDA1177330.1 hypothetical protein [Planctomycetota bacterium]
MQEITPHYLLLTATDSAAEHPQGRWNFLLHRLDRHEISEEASDIEHNICGQRLELLAVVRGLEALQQPSRVTLVTEDRYVVRGLRFGLREWKANGWRWERFGRWVSVKHTDLWQRLDRALQFHYVRGRHDRLGDAGLSPRIEPMDGRYPYRPVRSTNSPSRPTSLRPAVPALVRRLRGTLAASVSDAWADPQLALGHSG